MRPLYSLYKEAVRDNPRPPKKTSKMKRYLINAKDYIDKIAKNSSFSIIWSRYRHVSMVIIIPVIFLSLLFSLIFKRGIIFWILLFLYFLSIGLLDHYFLRCEGCKSKDFLLNGEYKCKYCGHDCS